MMKRWKTSLPIAPRARAAALLWLLLALTLLYTFGNSLKTQEASLAQSRSAEEIVRAVVEPVVGAEQYAGLDVRKLAHFTEFFLIGAELALLLAVSGRTRRGHALCALLSALACAVADESLQMLSDRGPEVRDVLLDFSGACCGLVVCALTILCALALRSADRMLLDDKS